jgi:hypothetical protein
MGANITVTSTKSILRRAYIQQELSMDATRNQALLYVVEEVSTIAFMVLPACYCRKTHICHLEQSNHEATRTIF